MMDNLGVASKPNEWLPVFHKSSDNRSEGDGEWQGGPRNGNYHHYHGSRTQKAKCSQVAVLRQSLSLNARGENHMK